MAISWLSPGNVYVWKSKQTQKQEACHRALCIVRPSHPQMTKVEIIIILNNYCLTSGRQKRIVREHVWWSSGSVHDSGSPDNKFQTAAANVFFVCHWARYLASVASPTQVIYIGSCSIWGILSLSLWVLLLSLILLLLIIIGNFVFLGRKHSPNTVHTWRGWPMCSKLGKR